MRFYGKKTLIHAARQLRGRLVRHGLVLGYHRIAEPKADPFGVCTSPSSFEAHLDYLSRRANVVSLAELAAARAAGRIAPRSVAITFDDGYVDNFRVAKPLLEHYGMPATFFIATGFLGGEFWWDRLARILGARQPTESIEIDGVRHPLRQGRSIQDAYRLLIRLSERDRDDCLARMDCSGEDSNRANGGGAQVMSEDDLKGLAAAGFSIGSHTVSHPLLGTLPPQEQRLEIERSKATLDSLLGREVTELAYPNGSRSGTTMALVKQAGFEIACASHKDVVWRGSDPFALPRFWPGERSLETFLSGWL